MITISGYRITETLYESSRTLVYRGLRNFDGVPVVLKMLRQEYTSPRTLTKFLTQRFAQFQMEYNIIRSLDVEGVIKTYGLETYQQSPVIVLQDFGGESLSQRLQNRLLNLEEFLTLALQITQTLGEIHQRNIMHKDINPSNIVLNPKTGQVKIIDFGIATVLAQENPTPRNPNVLEGTLAYMSPEQTGRMNRDIDYRTDFYSLGVTFYQLLCDRLPFETTDIMELVHHHIARQPIPPHRLNPDIPPSLSQLVMKLLAKIAENRYQSARGICADLQQCLDQLQHKQPFASFPLGCQDLSDKFQIPQKLYGREREVAALLAVFEQVLGNGRWEVGSREIETQNSKLPHSSFSNPSHSQFVLISGPPGIGKTTLVRELYKPMTQRRGYFIAGKFDPLQRNVPYACLIQAFQELIRQLLTETEDQLNRWREKLQMALGINGQVIVDVIPEVQLIVGKQPDLLQLPPTESENRFNWVFQNFIHVFTQAEHPLIIFLDDLQWADTASLQFIQWLMIMPDNQYLLIIGAFRDTEVDLTHPLMQTLDEIRRAEGLVEQITVPPLRLEDIHHLVQDTLHCEPERSHPLAELVLRKTSGNPFFINEFLKFLHQNHLIRFDFRTGSWHWSLDQIQQVQSTDNVIELVIDKVQRLSPTNRYVLQLAACIGHQFDLQTLATISEKPPPTVATELWEAMQEGLILPIGDEYKYLPFEQATSYQQSVIEIAQDSPTTADLTSDIFYKFTHDRVQQAVYSLISEADKKHCHGKIGRLLLAVIPPEQLEERVFEVIDHLNIGAEMMVESDAKIELARLNLIAGQKAKTSVAYESALNYLSMGLSLLPGDRWQKDYKLTLALTELAAEVSYLTGDFEQMEQLAEQVLRHAQTDLDKTNVYLVKIQACIAQNRLLDAIRTALQALELLGTKLPEKPSRFEVLQGLIRTKLALAGRQIENLVNLPRMTDPYKLAVMRVIASVCTPTYFLVPELWQLMVFQKIQLSVKYGNAPGSAFGYADYGMILCGVEQNIKAGYRFSQLASTLQSQLNAREFIPKTTLLVNMYLKHWQEHLRETVNPLLEAYQRGLETGDLEYGTFAIAYRFYHSYLLGRELLQLEQEMSSYERAIAQFKQILPLNLTRIYHQAILNLMGQSEDPCQLTGKSYNEDESLPQHLAADDRYTVFNLYFNKLILSYLFQNTAQATEYAQKTEQLLAEGAVGLLVVPAFYFYHSLAQIAVFPEANQTQQVQILRSVTANQKKIKRWAEHAPMNYLHKFYLVEAEQHRILGQDTEAGEKYDRAIAIAKEQEYQNEEALAHELAGRFYLAKGKTLIAQAYLRAAHYGYLKWGASAKVSQLEHCYPQFFGLSQQTSSVSLSGSLTSSPTTTSRTGAEILDLAAIMKASQALSDEIVLDKLLAKLMMILIENAGADRGCLLLETQGKWQVRAEGNVNSGSITVYQRIEQEISHNASMAIVNYVARTQESVVLNHAAEETRFGQDAYIQQHQPKSILCTPLVYQGKLSGVLYLENNLTTDAFTAERLEILQLLSGQAAISIDNARLYSELELRVQERTTELIQMNERLKQLTTELQRSNQDLEQFAYIASHDLQEPLRAIISYTQMLAKKYQGKLDEKADLYIHFAVDGAVRMQQLIRDLLAYSRAGRQDLKRQPTDCNLVIQKVLQDLQVAIAESNATITTDPLPTLNADPNQLFLLFQNLIGNAIKYRGEEPPQIDVSATSLQKLDNQEEPDTWLFSIRDNGIGIEPQYCDRIFGIFQRLHTQEEYSGTGLGLAISQKIVERHGGRIWVESQAGQGSTFYIEIPAWEK